MAPLLAGVIALIALILLPGYFFYFDITPKIVALLAGTSVVLITYAAKVMRSGNQRLGSASPVFSALLLASAWSLALSTAASVRPGLSLFGSTWRRYGSVIQAVVLLFAWLVYRTCAGRPERVRTILRGIALSGAISAVYGIVQFAGWDPLLPAAAYHIGEGIWTIVRPPGTLGYASYFATWLVFVAFLSLAEYQMEESRAWRLLAAAAAGLAAIAILLTGTRAALLALVAGGAVWTFLKRPGIAGRQVGVAACLALAALAAFYYSPPGRQLRSRTRWFAEDPWGGARRDLWRDSLRMSSHRLLAGYGPEVFTAEFPRFESVALAQSYPDFSHESPHNFFLDALVSQGIPGLAILGLLCADGFRRAWRLKSPWIAAALAAGLVSQQFTAFTMPTALIFFTVLGLLAALDEGPGKTPPGNIPHRALVVAPAVVAASIMLYLAVRLTLADSALALANRDLQREDLRAAVTHYQSYEQYRLPGVSADLWYSRSMLNVALHSKNPLTRTGAMLQAEGAAIKATRTTEDPFNSWYNLAVISGLHNDGARAEYYLRNAIAANPNWYKPHWTLAQVLRAEGRIEDARKEASLGLQLDGGKHPEVAKALDEIRSQPAGVPFTQLQK